MPIHTLKWLKLLFDSASQTRPCEAVSKTTIVDTVADFVRKFVSSGKNRCIDWWHFGSYRRTFTASSSIRVTSSRTPLGRKVGSRDF